MVAPKARSPWCNCRDSLSYLRSDGIVLDCPECSAPFWPAPLRVETPDDYPPGEAPRLAESGPLGFIARCDTCGFRVEMHGNRLPTVAMMGEAP